MCGLQNPEDPNMSPMADNAITRGSIGGLESPVYIYLMTNLINQQ